MSHEYFRNVTLRSIILKYHRNMTEILLFDISLFNMSAIFLWYSNFAYGFRILEVQRDTRAITHFPRQIYLCLSLAWRQELRTCNTQSFFYRGNSAILSKLIVKVILRVMWAAFRKRRPGLRDKHVHSTDINSFPHRSIFFKYNRGEGEVRLLYCVKLRRSHAIT